MIELLVVVAIIALLIAMILPVLRASRQAAQAAVCASNLHQVHLGFNVYALEFRDYMPQMSNSWWGRSWETTLGNQGYFGGGQNWGPYVTRFGLVRKRWAIFQCPGEEPKSLQTTDFNYTKVLTTNFDNEMMRTSFAYNWQVSQYNYDQMYLGPMPWGVNPGHRRGFSNPRRCRPADFNFLADARLWWFGWDLPYFEWGVDTVPDYFWSHMWRHPGQSANMAYLDGHVARRQHVTETGVSNFPVAWQWYPEYDLPR